MNRQRTDYLSSDAQLELDRSLMKKLREVEENVQRSGDIKDLRNSLNRVRHSVRDEAVESVLNRVERFLSRVVYSSAHQ